MQKDSSLIGRTLSHYRIVKKIASGGMGSVYVAEDTKLSRQVALKALPAEMAQNEERRSRFEREAKAVAALNHPNIVMVHSVEEVEGVHFITMELVRGKTLSELLPKHGLSLSKFFGIAVPLTDAVAAAHQSGITHRDLKPDNVMLSEEGRVKVLDFGLAKPQQGFVSGGSGSEVATEHMTREGGILGTLHYMSPEQAEGKSVDHRSDIFSLGIIFYEMLTGHRPFAGETPASIISSIIKDTPLSVTELKPSIPRDLAKIIKRCLAKDPERRYQNSKDVRNELEEAKQDVDTGEAFEGATVVRPSMFARGMKVWLGATAAVAVLVGAFLFFRGSAAPPLTERDTILLTDFTNTTGEAVFDDTLKQALAIQLGQSPYLNILPEERVRETLELMGRLVDERVTRAIGREICQREGIKAMLAGSIAGLGSTYVITLDAVNCRTGESLAGEQVEAESQDEVLKALGSATSRLRGKLGESLSTVEQLDAPIERATTPSLAALKAFSLAEIERAKASPLSAIPLYKRAIELDPNFALAHARLGTVYDNAGEPDLAREHRTKAFALRDRVSELEKLYITAHYYNAITGEIDRARETYELWKKTYPRNWTPYNNLAVNYMDIGGYEKAVEEAREALRLEPNHSLPYANLGWAYLFLGRLDEAEAIFQQAVERGLDAAAGIHQALYRIAYLEGDAAAMTREVEWSRGKPGESGMLGTQAFVAGEAGKVGKARRLRERASELALQRGLKQVAAGYLLDQAVLEGAFGNAREARQTVDRAFDLQGSDAPDGRAGLALALAGDLAGAEAQSDALAASRAPTDTLFHARTLPRVRAAIALGRNDPGRAIELLEPARTYELGGGGAWVVLLRGRAHLGADEPLEAATELQKILDRRSLFAGGPAFSLALLELARSKFQAGDSTASRRAYQDLLARWKDADPDLPVLQQAKAEYARLGS